MRNMNANFGKSRIEEIQISQKENLPGKSKVSNMASGGQRRLSHIGNYGLTTTTLGKGSFSKVVLADHVILNKQVALKVVTISKIKDPYVWKTLKREAAIMTKLNHPNIVTLHEVVSAGDFYCLVLDFYSGGNLCNMIGNQDGNKLDEELSR